MLAAPGPAVRTIRFAVYAVLIVAVQTAVGAAAAGSTRLAVLAMAAAIALPLALFSPSWVVALAFPGVVLSSVRLGSGAVDLSYSDAILVGAAVLSLREAPWHSASLRRHLAPGLVYLGILGITVLFNPTTRAVLEWVHRVELMLGAIVIGASLAASGKTRLALRLYVLTCVVIAVAAVEYSIRNDFAPAYPFDSMNKNAAGFFLSAGLIVAMSAPTQIAVPRVLLAVAQGTMVVGLVACQARASAATFILVLFIAAVRRSARSVLVPLIGIAALGAMIWTTVEREAQQDASQRQFGSYETRMDVYRASIEIWQEEPVFGAGLRFFSDPEVLRRTFTTEPHNLFISALGESGVVGLAGFVVLNGWVVLLLVRRRDPIGQCALYLSIAHMVDSLAGIYWVAGSGSLPWLVVGLAAYADRPVSMGRGDESAWGEPAGVTRAMLRPNVT